MFYRYFKSFIGWVCFGKENYAQIKYFDVWIEAFGNNMVTNVIAII